MEFSSPAQFHEYAQDSGHSFVSISLSQNSEVLGSMLIELYTDVTPATCEHFMKGCKSSFPGGFKYKGSPIHRVVRRGFIQGGDVVDGTGKGKGTARCSINGCLRKNCFCNDLTTML